MQSGVVNITYDPSFTVNIQSRISPDRDSTQLISNPATMSLKPGLPRRLRETHDAGSVGVIIRMNTLISPAAFQFSQ
jgi:hypothetical protein